MTEPRAFTTITQSVTALQWTGDNHDAVRAFTGVALVGIHDRGWVSLVSGRTSSRAQPGDWLVQDAAGTLSVLPPAVFDELYVLADGGSAEPLEIEEASSADAAESVVDPTLADA